MRRSNRRAALYALTTLGVLSVMLFSFSTTESHKSWMARDEMSMLNFSELDQLLSISSNPLFQRSAEPDVLSPQYLIRNVSIVNENILQLEVEKPNCAQDTLYLQADFNLNEKRSILHHYAGRDVVIRYRDEEQNRSGTLSSLRQIETIEDQRVYLASNDNQEPTPIERIRRCPQCFENETLDIQAYVYSAFVLSASEIFLTVNTNCSGLSITLNVLDHKHERSSFIQDLNKREIILRNTHVGQGLQLTIADMSSIVPAESSE